MEADLPAAPEPQAICEMEGDPFFKLGVVNDVMRSLGLVMSVSLLKGKRKLPTRILRR